MEGIGGDDFSAKLKTCAVFGGRGFVGQALVERLLKLGNWSVRVVDSIQSPLIHPSESLLAEAISSGRASYLQVDVRIKMQIIKAIVGASVVFYTDSVESLPCEFYICYKTIVQGMKNVVDACRECKVKHLICSSPADVVFRKSCNIKNGDESMPYSDQLEDMFTDLKAQAESLVLSANDIDGLLTCVIRPCNVFGPGEKNIVPSLVSMAQSSWAKFVIGSGDNVLDFTYVDNVTHALICAEESLNSRMVSVCGKVFFITNLEPMKFREFTYLVLAGLGYQRPVISLPTWMVRNIIFLAKFLRSKYDSRKLNSCTSVHKIADLALCTRTFDCSAAEKYLNYSPVVSMEEGIALTVKFSSYISRDSPGIRSEEPSKVEMLLGSGKVSDLLLWRDEKQTFFCFLLLVLLYQWFFLSGRTFISSSANLLLLITFLLCGYRILPLNMYGWKIPKLSPPSFEISEVDMRNSFLAVTRMWNGLCCLVNSLAQGSSLANFFKVFAFLYVCKLIVPNFLTTAIGVALVLVFTMCFTYEQYEKEIDEMFFALLSSSKKGMLLFAQKLPKPLTDIVGMWLNLWKIACGRWQSSQP